MTYFPIFDFDGVIVNTFDMALKITQMYDPEITAEEYKALMKGNIFDSFKTLERNREAREKFDFFAHYTPALMKLAPVENIQNVLKLLTEPTAIISSTISAPINEFLTLHNLRSYFSDILGADIERSKVVKLTKIKDLYASKNLIFITDTLGDILEASKLDIPSIGVTWGFHQKELLEQGKPLKIVDSVEELLTALL